MRSRSDIKEALYKISTILLVPMSSNICSLLISPLSLSVSLSSCLFLSISVSLSLFLSLSLTLSLPLPLTLCFSLSISLSLYLSISFSLRWLWIQTQLHNHGVGSGEWQQGGMATRSNLIRNKFPALGAGAAGGKRTLGKIFSGCYRRCVRAYIRRLRISSFGQMILRLKVNSYLLSAFKFACAFPHQLPRLYDSSSVQNAKHFPLLQFAL